MTHVQLLVNANSEYILRGEVVQDEGRCHIFEQLTEEDVLPFDFDEKDEFEEAKWVIHRTNVVFVQLPKGASIENKYEHLTNSISKSPVNGPIEIKPHSASISQLAIIQQGTYKTVNGDVIVDAGGYEFQLKK